MTAALDPSAAMLIPFQILGACKAPPLRRPPPLRWFPVPPKSHPDPYPRTGLLITAHLPLPLHAYILLCKMYQRDFPPCVHFASPFASPFDGFCRAKGDAKTIKNHQNVSRRFSIHKGARGVQRGSEERMETRIKKEISWFFIKRESGVTRLRRKQREEREKKKGVFSKQ